METPHQFTTIGCVLGLAWASAVQASAPPTQKPTPKPGTLAALASSTKLSRGQGSAHTGVIVITDDNLTDLGQGAALTVMTSTIAETGASSIRDMGSVMNTLRSKVQGRADMKAVSQAVKDQLNS